MTQRILFLILFASLLFASVSPLYAQYGVGDGCDSRAQALISPTTALDYAGACQAYDACVAAINQNYPDPRCHLAAVKVLLASCLPADVRCRESALLDTAMILTLQSAPLERTGSYRRDVPDDEILSVTTMAKVLSEFQQGDDSAALSLLTNIPSWGQLAFGEAVIYEALGQNDAALAAYAAALDNQSDDPLVHYARALLYADLGKTSLAAFETAWLTDFTENYPDWRTLIDPLIDRFPLEQPFTDWALYPVRSLDFGSGGNFVEDNSLEPAYALQIAFDPAGSALFIRNFSNTTDCREPCSDLILLTQEEAGGNFRGTHQDYIDVHLSPTGGNFYGSASWALCVDACTTRDFYLAPAGAPDPRTALGGERCGALPRLALGMQGETAQPPGLSLFDSPAGNSTEDGNNGYYWNVLVIGGDKCIEDQRWWEVITPEGDVGWMPENAPAYWPPNTNSDYYLINPIENSWYRQFCRSQRLTSRYCTLINGRLVIQ